MKLALYQSQRCQVVLEYSEYRKDDEFVRVSEFVEVDFPPREIGEVTAEKVKQLDAVLEELMTQIERVRSQKQELLALSHEHE